MKSLFLSPVARHYLSFSSVEQANLALYSFANGQIIPALRLLYRSRYLALLICGDNHPDMALLDVSIQF